MKYIITLNGKKYEAMVERVDNFRSLTREQVGRGELSAPAPQSAAVPAASTLPAPASAPAPVSAGSRPVKSPMPGKILDIKVTPGAGVKRGQVLLVMEAMKMENEIVAPTDGIVGSIPIKKGDTVDTDDVLVVLK